MKLVHGISWLLAASIATWAPTLFAQSNSALAEALFQDAKQLLATGKVHEACEKFSESHRLDPATGTLLRLADCHEKEGLSASAWGEFTQAAGLAARGKQADREQFARERASKIEPHLCKVKIVVTSPVEGLAVKLNGKELFSGAFGTAVPVDPGNVKVEAVAPGKKSWSMVVVFALDAEQKVVEVPALETEAKAVAAPVPVMPEGPKVVHKATRNLIPGLVVGGVGLVGLGVGTFFGVSAMGKKQDGDALCSGRLCSQAGLDLQSDAKSAATISTIGFAVGVVGLGVGVVLLLTSGRGEDTIESESSRTKATLNVGPLGLSGTW